MRSNLLLPPTFLCASSVGMLPFHSLAPVAYLILSAWKYLGIVPVPFGVVMNPWAKDLVKQCQTAGRPYLRPTILVTSGPLRLSRHPMYQGLIAIVVGPAVVLGSASPMIVVFDFALLLSVMFVPMEDKVTEEEFATPGASTRAVFEDGYDISSRVIVWTYGKIPSNLLV